MFEVTNHDLSALNVALEGIPQSLSLLGPAHPSQIDWKSNPLNPGSKYIYIYIYWLPFNLWLYGNTHGLEHVAGTGGSTEGGRVLAVLLAVIPPPATHKHLGQWKTIVVGFLYSHAHQSSRSRTSTRASN